MGILDSRQIFSVFQILVHPAKMRIAKCMKTKRLRCEISLDNVSRSCYASRVNYGCTFMNIVARWFMVLGILLFVIIMLGKLFDWGPPAPVLGPPTYFEAELLIFKAQVDERSQQINELIRRGSVHGCQR